ncbi:helical backbone metal receptor [Ramlibacter sp.]|uniref:ABC transporter substrate-binding protein n=1 Tax=Ramlibacter sp. TaxID=1917967 RepID=UPI002C807992|nr:helical backbone metal receptor [Ramlibacter sp.]HWI80451.1 helical backbone metal receptor [Ramlibacter sp.]
MGERRRLIGRWLLAAVLCAAALTAPAAPVVDDRGIAVDLARPPQRVVTMLPSLAETVCELGACERLVGVDSYADWPPGVRALPRIGGVDDANIERIVALHPDLVLLSATSPALARLQALGVPVFGVELKTLADVRRNLVQVGRLLQVAGAEAAWQRIEAGIAQAAHELPPRARGASVYFEISGGPYAAGAGSHIGELLTRLGAVNIVPPALGSVPKLNPEFVVRADPQVIMLAADGERPPAERPGWNRIRAVRDGRVCAFTPAESNVLSRPGPRLAEAARILARCLQRNARGGGS